MERVEFNCPLQAAYHFTRLIAEQGRVQLDDQHVGNEAINKRYQETYMACEEAERSLRYISQHILLHDPPEISEWRRRPIEVGLQEMLDTIRDVDAQLHEKVEMHSQLAKQLSQKTRKLQALHFYRPLIEQEVSHRELLETDSSSIELSILNNNSMVTSVTGFCPNHLIRRLLTTACRATRRNVAFQIGEAIGDSTPYTIFVSSPDMLVMLAKICESFGPDVFEFPASGDQLMSEEIQLKAEIAQMENIERQTRALNDSYLDDIASNYWNWRMYIAREKQIWMALDYGNFGDNSVSYSGWCPVRFMSQLPALLDQATQDSGSPIPITMSSTPAEQCMDLVPPTFIETTEFSSSFQMLNDAYGIPSYDELNGGAFYAMYPFLFGIMFGDLGHSFFYLLGAIGLFVMSWLKPKGEMASFYSFKWLLLVASLSAFYCGFLYNECFGLPINFFGSSWVKDLEKSTEAVDQWKMKDKRVYPFGIDPTWFFKDTELVFLNSYKMKVSVIMGLSQMVFGMVLQLINHIHRKDYKDIIMGWIPEIMYLVPFFGYLVFAILKKWCSDFSDPSWDPSVKGQGVNLIQMQIAMLLSLGKKDISLQLYPEQWTVHTVIIVLFLMSIPLLLFVKPIHQCVVKRKDPDFNVLEIFVMNLIHVIEFCLEALSHIASYLRLWALSLAHSQLSHVLWEQLFLLCFNMHNPVMLFVGFAAFAAMSVAILLGMEAFSALLHAIRLMWVEFSSKFYAGLGVEFKPLSLEVQLKATGVSE